MKSPIFEINKTESEWKNELSPAQYYVLRQKGTEKPYSGELLLQSGNGIYQCAACGNELFSHDMKFESHCGWPSFDKEITGGKILQIIDSTHGMQRTEIICAKCGSHLGHIFDDGPTETGKRYCVNSLSLEFVPVQEYNNKIDTITLAGGCFWCIEAVFLKLTGVLSVQSGYTGGNKENPTYEQVCKGNTGHAEAIQITYDQTNVSLEEILKVFFSIHDPTTLNRQGADIGTQYRSGIFYHHEEQKTIAENIISKINQEKIFLNPVVTEVIRMEKFYKAEGYHQNYYNNNKNQSYCRMIILPKVEKFEKLFREMIKK